MWQRDCLTAVMLSWTGGGRELQGVQKQPPGQKVEGVAGIAARAELQVRNLRHAPRSITGADSTG